MIQIHDVEEAVNPVRVKQTLEPEPGLMTNAHRRNNAS